MPELTIAGLLATSGKEEAPVIVPCESLLEDDDEDVVIVVDGVTITEGCGGTPSTRDSRRPGVALSLSMVVSQALTSPVSARTNRLLARRFNMSLSPLPRTSASQCSRYHLNVVHARRRLSFSSTANPHTTPDDNDQFDGR